MCGRYAQAQGMDEIIERFDLDGSLVDKSLPLNWNIAPTNEIYIIRENQSGRVLDSVNLSMKSQHFVKLFEQRGV
jgi:putative SOS response-associated peptidase YedK